MLTNAIHLVNILNNEQPDKPKFRDYKDLAQSFIEEAFGTPNQHNKKRFFIAFRIFDQTYQNLKSQYRINEDFDSTHMIVNEEEDGNQEYTEDLQVETSNSRITTKLCLNAFDSDDEQ